MKADSYELTQQGRILSPGKTSHPDRPPTSAREGGNEVIQDSHSHLFIYPRY